MRYPTQHGAVPPSRLDIARKGLIFYEEKTYPRVFLEQYDINYISQYKPPTLDFIFYAHHRWQHQILTVNSSFNGLYKMRGNLIQVGRLYLFVNLKKYIYMFKVSILGGLVLFCERMIFNFKLSGFRSINIPLSGLLELKSAQ